MAPSSLDWFIRRRMHNRYFAQACVPHSRRQIFQQASHREIIQLFNNELGQGGKVMWMWGRVP